MRGIRFSGADSSPSIWSNNLVKYDKAVKGKIANTRLHLEKLA
jgi:hypothetical protein